MDAGQSIIDNLEPFVWSNDESIAYEVTIEMINEVVGLYAALSESQRQSAPPEVLEQWSAERRKWGRRIDDLNPADHAEIERTQQECRDLIDRLRHT